MKRLIHILVAVILVITISACGENKPTNKQDLAGQTTPTSVSKEGNLPNTEVLQKEIAVKNDDTLNATAVQSTTPINPTSEKNSTDIPNGANQQKDTANNKQGYSFYGDWEIKRLVAVPPVAADPEKDSKKLIGKKITYSADLVSFGDKVLNNPRYKITTELKQSFESGNRISFESIGYKGDSIVMVLVYAEVHEWDSPGGYFYVKNNDTLILPSDGGFFEMVRTK